VVSWLKYGCAICLPLYGFTYGVAVGPICWFLSSELAPQRHRSLIQTICYSVNGIMVFILTTAFQPLDDQIHEFAFVILFIIPSLFCILYLFYQLPETKGREIHEIVTELRGGRTEYLDCEQNSNSSDSNA